MKKETTKWVRYKSSLHNKLETASIIGAHEERRRIFKILTDECALNHDFIEYLFNEKYPAKVKKEKV